jgi:hypothetical protein
VATIVFSDRVEFPDGLKFGDPGPRGTVGVRQIGDQLLFRVKACDEASDVASLELLTTNDLRVIWRVESDTVANPDVPDVFMAGVTPPGFEERTHLDEVLTPGTHYLISVSLRSQLGPLSVEFDPGELNGGTWRVRGRRKLTDDEFDRLRPCG